MFWGVRYTHDINSSVQQQLEHPFLFLRIPKSEFPAKINPHEMAAMVSSSASRGLRHTEAEIVKVSDVRIRVCDCHTAILKPLPGVHLRLTQARLVGLDKCLQAGLVVEQRGEDDVGGRRD